MPARPPETLLPRNNLQRKGFSMKQKAKKDLKKRSIALFAAMAVCLTMAQAPAFTLSAHAEEAPAQGDIVQDENAQPTEENEEKDEEDLEKENLDEETSDEENLGSENQDGNPDKNDGEVDPEKETEAPETEGENPPATDGTEDENAEVPEKSSLFESFYGECTEAIGSAEDQESVLQAIEGCLNRYDALTDEEKAELAEVYEMLLAYKAEVSGTAKGEAMNPLESVEESDLAPQAGREWVYTVEEAVKTDARDVERLTNQYTEARTNIADPDLYDLLKQATIFRGWSFAVYDNETYTFPKELLEEKAEIAGATIDLSAPGIHNLYITDAAAASFIPSWDVEKADDGSVKVNGITIQGTAGSSFACWLYYVHYDMEDETTPDVICAWRVFVEATGSAAEGSNTIPASPDANENYFWYGTAKPNYERVWTTENRDNRLAASMVMTPMKNSSYTWTPDSTIWTADGNHNYNVTYCAEMGIEVNPAGEKYRVGKIIEESKFDKETQDKLRAIVENGYPFLSAEEMNARMGTNYDTAILTAATQYAVWSITDNLNNDVTAISTQDKIILPAEIENHLKNPNGSNKYIFAGPDDPVYGSLYGETPLYTYLSYANGNEGTTSDEKKEAAAAVNKVVDYLLNSCTASTLQDEFQITEANETFTRNKDGSYNLTVTGSFSREAAYVDNELETISISLTDGTNTAEGIVEGTNFTVTLENILEGTEVILNAAAVLHDRMQVYYYTSESGQYQNFIGGNVGHSVAEDNKLFTTPVAPKGSLIINKNLADNAPEEAKTKEYTFTVAGPNEYNETVTITGAGQKILENLEPGAYTVTEQDAAINGYNWKVSVNGTSGSTITVTVEGNADAAEATFTNSYDRPTTPPTEPEEPDEPEKPEEPDEPETPPTTPPTTPPETPPTEEVPEEEPPLTDIPDLEIPEEEVPLAEMPPEEEIPEEEVPLADIPKTGDTDGSLWAMLLAFCTAGVALLARKLRGEKNS